MKIIKSVIENFFKFFGYQITLEKIPKIHKIFKNSGLNLCLALNYGSRKEILDGVKSTIRKIQKKELTIDQVDEVFFSKQLYTKNYPDPDLMIRTSGEYRLSNFLLWQSAYTEIYMTSEYLSLIHISEPTRR